MDQTLRNVGLNGKGLITCGQRIVTGAPDTVPNKYISACIIQNEIDHNVYKNNGTEQVVVWVILGTGGGGGGTPSGDEICGGAIDGINTAFTVANIPLAGTQFQLFLNGQAQIEGFNYTRIGVAITMTSAPFAGILFANYYY